VSHGRLAAVTDSSWAQLPERFMEKRTEMVQADLLLIFGTSLTVHPFASLAWLVPPGCPRVLFNLEEAGDIGKRPDDVLVLEECDMGVRKLAQLLGWEDELDAEWATTVLPADDQRPEAKPEDHVRTGQEDAKDHVQELAADIAASLHIGGSPNSKAATSPPELSKRADADESSPAETPNARKSVEDPK
jgi:NAD-dependent histone deacetylase SIR2